MDVKLIEVPEFYEILKMVNERPFMSRIINRNAELKFRMAELSFNTMSATRENAAVDLMTAVLCAGRLKNINSALNIDIPQMLGEASMFLAKMRKNKVNLLFKVYITELRNIVKSEYDNFTLPDINDGSGGGTHGRARLGAISGQ